MIVDTQAITNVMHERSTPRIARSVDIELGAGPESDLGGYLGESKPEDL